MNIGTVKEGFFIGERKDNGSYLVVEFGDYLECGINPTTQKVRK